MKSSVQIGPYLITAELPDFSSLVPRPSSLVINTLNTHSWVVAEKDTLFREALVSSDVLLPDGEGIVWAVKRLTGQKIQKIAGYDLFIHMLEYLQRTGGTCFFLGGTQHTLNLIKARLAIEYPNVKAGFYSPPFKPEFSEKDSFEILDHIINYKSLIINSDITVLFVGMTAPKQEKWVFRNKHRIDADIVCSIGAVFDFYAGTVKRPPRWMIWMKLEWLGRLLASPGKIWKRVFISTPRFIWSIINY